MANEVSVYSCDTAAKAEQAKQYLLQRGYDATGIVVSEQASVFIYDGVTYDGGTHDNLSGKFIVVGRK